MTVQRATRQLSPHLAHYGSKKKYIYIMFELCTFLGLCDIVSSKSYQINIRKFSRHSSSLQQEICRTCD